MFEKTAQIRLSETQHTQRLLLSIKLADKNNYRAAIYVTNHQRYLVQFSYMSNTNTA